MSSKKRTFTLKSIDSNIMDKINEKYGLVIVSNIQKEAAQESASKTTKISDIICNSETDQSFTFLDENKKNIDCEITMVEISTMKSLPNKTNIHCFWCKHSFSTIPIGCPIKFINHMLEKSYISYITKDKYYMKENVTDKKLNFISSNIEPSKHIDVQPIKNNHYLTDGIFCSFNCILAFIKDNNHDLYYRESYSLLHSLYEDLTGQKAKKMSPAPHWRLLTMFGGPKKIEDFRKDFNTIQYEFMFNLRDMKSIAKAYREKTI